MKIDNAPHTQYVGVVLKNMNKLLPEYLTCDIDLVTHLLHAGYNRSCFIETIQPGRKPFPEHWAIMFLFRYRKKQYKAVL